jgi:molecular chaperone GrpE
LKGDFNLKDKSAKKTIRVFSAEDQNTMDEYQKLETGITENIEKNIPSKPPIGSEPSDDKTEKDKKDELNTQVNEWKQKAEEERDRVLRVLAEFENYKKRMNRQMDDYKKYANELLLKELLSVVDNLERAIVSSEGVKDNPRESCVVEGVEMTLNEILKLLEKFHVTSFEALGKPFDPVFHEAVMQQESRNQPENSVIHVLQKGYMIHDRLLRPAMVVVSKGQADGNQ